VGAQHLPQALVAALADQVEVEGTQRGPERPRLDGDDLVAGSSTAGSVAVTAVTAVTEAEAHLVAGRGHVVGREPQLEHPGRVDPAQRLAAPVGRDRSGPPGPQHPPSALVVHPQQAVGVGVLAGGQRFVRAALVGARTPDLRPPRGHATRPSTRPMAVAGMSAQLGRWASS
jgi:hypothetical protein